MEPHLTKDEIAEIIDRDFNIIDSLDNASFLWAFSNDRGYLIKLNDLWEELSGYTVKELTDEPFINFLHPDDVSKTMKHYYNGEHFHQDAKVTNGFTNRYRCKEDGYMILEWYSSGRNKDGFNWSIAIFKGYE